MIIRYNEQKGCWEEHKEPYTTIAVQTEEAFNFIKVAVEKQQPQEPLAHTTPGAYGRCPRCDKLLKSYYAKYCDQCGQKFDWSRRR